MRSKSTGHEMSDFHLQPLQFSWTGKQRALRNCSQGFFGIDLVPNSGVKKPVAKARFNTP